MSDLKRYEVGLLNFNNVVTPGVYDPEGDFIASADGKLPVYLASEVDARDAARGEVAEGLVGKLIGELLTRGLTARLAELSQEITAALRTHRQEGEAWQPMSTAPRDGTRILGANRDGQVFIVECRNGKNEWYMREADLYRDPVKWMPLPAAALRPRLPAAREGA